MPKNIDINAHVARYEDTDLQNVQALIDGLKALIERRTANEIEKYEAALAKLKKGEIPAAEPKPAKPERKTRGGKKVAASTTEEI